MVVLKTFIFAEYCLRRQKPRAPTESNHDKMAIFSRSKVEKKYQNFKKKGKNGKNGHLVVI